MREKPLADDRSQRLLERIFRCLWLACLASAIFFLGTGFGGYSVARLMADYVLEHFVCEAKQ